MSSQTLNPYSVISGQIVAAMNQIASSLDADSTENDLVKVVYEMVQPIYYPDATAAQEIEIKSVASNIINAYCNGALNTQPNFNAIQIYFIELLTGLKTASTTPINSLDSWYRDIEGNVSKANLSTDEQTSIFLATQTARTINNYWLDQIGIVTDWEPFLQNDLRDYANIPLWTIAAVEGALLGASASEKGLIAPTTDITSVDIVSSLIGAVTIAAGKVIFKWVPQIQPINISDAIDDELNFDKEIVVQLTGGQTGVAALGPKRSKRKKGHCRYSRDHFTQCTGGANQTLASRCVCGG